MAVTKLATINQIISQVFPQEASLIEDASQTKIQERFWLVSGNNALRWIIPQNSKYGLPILKQWRPYGSLSNLKWRTLITLYRLGKLDKLPGVSSLGVVDGFTENWQHLGNQNQQSLVPTIYVGTPSPTRKAVAFLLDSETKKLCGVAKVPLGTKAAARIIKEIDTLTCLATEKPNLAPRKLFLSRDRGIGVQTPITGNPVAKELSTAHLEWLSRLLVPDKTTSISEQVKILKQQLLRLTDFDLREYKIIEQEISTLNNSTPLPVTWVHGDFAPWNLKWIAPQKLAVLDWEEARADGLPLQDLFHYFYIQSYLLQPNANFLERTFAMPSVSEHLQSWGIDWACYLQLAKFYLVESWIRSTEKGDLDYATFAASELSLTLKKLLL